MTCIKELLYDDVSGFFSFFRKSAAVVSGTNELFIKSEKKQKKEKVQRVFQGFFKVN